MRKPDIDERALDAMLRRVFGRPVAYERAGDGVSTQVYRLHDTDRTLYLRFAEKVGETMAAEADVHRRLVEAGAKVPEVVHIDEADDVLGRAFAITTEIAGEPVGYDDLDPDVLRAAGRDFARIASIPVEGFGWLRGDVGPRLVGQDGDFQTSASRIVLEQLPRVRELLGVPATTALERLIEDLDDIGEAHLAHGDLDGTHIYASAGMYSGIIDFGEIRGAEPHYDLAHFLLHHGKAVDHVGEGWREITTSVPDPSLLRRTAVLIGAFRVAWAFHRYGDRAATADAPRWYAKRTASLLFG